MNDRKSQQAERIFLAASEIGEAERGAFVAAECAGDEELLAEVGALLAAGIASESYFGGLSGRLGIERLRDSEPATVSRGEAGQAFGHYRLTAKLGAGGTGEVWRAERSDGRFEGDVAVKLLTRLGSESALSQFDGEANYLARLTHANVARLIDAGVGPGDVPFLILDYVDGRPIDEYCNAHALGIDARIALFGQVLDAVSHAHAHLIVHSDIKPSNVMVTPDGSVKLLDFGIATLLTAVDTRGQAAGLTPEYAAPEQLAGQGVTTATDIYSLGLLLYVLLAGTSPRRLEATDSLGALRRAAMRDAPSLATIATTTGLPDSQSLEVLAAERGASPGTYLRTLQGELDLVVRKALAPDPAARYRTVNDFASDLRRYRQNEPVAAHPDSVRYRTRKFVQRHRGSVLTGSLTLLAILAASVIATWQGIEAGRQRDLAIRGQERALATSSLLNKLLGELDPEGDEVSLQDLLDRGVAMVEQEYGDQERTRATTLYDLSILYGRLGQVDTQVELLDRAETVSRNLGEEALVATTLCAKARLKRETDAVGAADDLAAGLAAFDALPRRERARDIECRRAEALAKSADGDHGAAIAKYREAIDAMESRDVTAVGWRLTLLNDLAEQYFLTGRFAEGLTTLDEILDENRRLGRERSVNHIIMLANRAAILMRFGEILKASASQQDAWRLVQQAENAPVGIRMHYASSLLRLEQPGLALELLSEDHAAAIATGNQRVRGQSAMLMGMALLALDRPGEAESRMDEAAGVYSSSPAYHGHLTLTLELLRARLARSTGDVAGARRKVEAALAELNYPRDKTQPGLLGALLAAARAALAAADAAAALEFASDARDVALAVARNPGWSADVGQALHLCAQARLALGDREAAIADLERAVESLRNGYGADHPETVEVRKRLAELGVADAS